MISEKLYGRTDIDEYEYSSKEMFNFLPAPMGGIFSRPGTVTQRQLDSDRAIIPWERSDGNYFIVYKQQPYPKPPGTPFLFEVYNENWVLQNLTDFSDGLGTGQLQNRDGSFTGLPTHKALIEYQTNAGLNLQDLDYNGFGYVTYNNSLILNHNSGVMPPLVFSIMSTGFVKVEHYQFSGELSVEKLSKNGVYFSSIDMAFGWQSSPYYINKDNTHLLPSIAVPGGQAGLFTTTYVTGTLTSYEGNTATLKDYFTADMKWTFLILNQGDTEGIYFITSIVSTTVANITCIAYGLNNTTKSRNFKRQLFASDLGFPKVISTFNNRLCFANTFTKPSWFFASATNNYRDIGATTPFQFLTTFPIVETDSFEFNLTSRAYSPVTWISHQGDVIMGTGTTEFSLTGGDGVISALNVSINPESNVGGSIVPAVKNSESIFFVSADGKSIRKVQYNFDVRGYRSQNMSILSDDIIYKLRPGQEVDSLASIVIVKIEWQESNRCLWVLTSTGNLFSITIEPSSLTAAWAYHIIGDNFEVTEIFTFQSSRIGRSVLGLIVKRETNYYIEFMAPEYLNDELVIDSLNIGDQPIFTDGSYLVSLPETMTPMDLLIVNFNGGILTSADLSDMIGRAQRLTTGKKVVLSAVVTPDAVLFNGAELYLIVQNTGYGYPSIFLAETLADAYAGISYEPAAVTSLTLSDAEAGMKYTKLGTFPHLANKTVDVIADGILREGLTVNANGIVTLPVAALKATIGYYYPATVIPVTPILSTKDGASQGSLMRARSASIRYYKSRTASVGSREGNLEPVVFPQVPFTGLMNTHIDSTTDTEYNFVIKKEKSLPLNVMSITFRGEVE